MRKIRCLILLILLGNNASAHNPQVSTISIIQNENKISRINYNHLNLIGAITLLHTSIPHLESLIKDHSLVSGNFLRNRTWRDSRD
jgi:hypothetical protein